MPSARSAQAGEHCATSSVGRRTSRRRSAAPASSAYGDVVTLVIVAVVAAVVVWLVTPRPTYTVLAIEIVWLPTAFHVAPSADSYPVIVVPLRTRRTHRGG